MLTARQIAQIHDLAAQGLSHRTISRRTGRARTTIARVLAAPLPLAGGVALRARRDLLRFRRRTYERCGGCGRLVILPCLACRIEEAAARQRLFRAA